MSTRQSRIAQLKELDTNLQVFGSDLHRYETHPLSLDDVDQFESALGIVLPEQYHQHLLSVGYGAGPYYGLYSPKTILEDLLFAYKEWEEDPDDLGPPPSPSIEFPFTRSDAKRIYEARAAGNNVACGAALYPSNGAIPIGTKGCSYDTMLVTAGELRGTVWDLDQDGACRDEAVVTERDLRWSPATWHPALRPTRLLEGEDQRVTHQLLSDFPTFNEWFDSWLAEAIVDLTVSTRLLNKSTNQGQRRDVVARRRLNWFRPRKLDR